MIRGILALVLIALFIHGGMLFWKASTWRQRLHAFRVLTSNIVILTVAALTLALIVQLF